jgi:hypothetical protein
VKQVSGRVQYSELCSLKNTYREVPDHSHDESTNPLSSFLSSMQSLLLGTGFGVVSFVDILSTLT